MLSPTLLSAIVHSLWADDSDPFHDHTYSALAPLLRELGERARARAIDQMPRIPAVARAKFDTHFAANTFGEDMTSWSFGADDAVTRYFWGRFRADALLRYSGEMHGVAAEQEFIDFGSPLSACLPTPTTVQDVCDQLMALTGTTPAICVGLVDAGVIAPGKTPDDFRGRLHHVETTDIEMSTHAKGVLAVLLERLQLHGILSQTKIFCALVRPTTQRIGLSCFGHDSSPEMLTAVQKLDTALNQQQLPAVINISMGTHVGPHNGISPLEDCLSAWTSNGTRFVFAAAGNEGERGLHMNRMVQASVPEFLSLTLGADGCRELLIELWWPHPISPTLAAEIDVTLPSCATPKPFLPLPIDSSTAASFPVLTGATTTPVRESLFHAQCRSGMSCMAFFLRSPNPGDLASAEIDIELKSPTDVMVNGWISVGGGARATFLGGGAGGTVNIPGTAKGIISVGGVKGNRAWRKSSYGPASRYQVGPLIVFPAAPTVAHDVSGCSLSTDEGTSFASPRAAADAANILLDPLRASQCTNVMNMVQELLHPRPVGPWNPRIGFGII
jgi:hypothetical protein